MNLQGWPFIVAFGVCYFAFSITYTMNDIAYWGMIPALDTDANARNQFTSRATLFAGIGNTLASVAIPMLTAGAMALGGNTKSAYGIISIIIGILAPAFLLITLLGVRENRADMEKAPEPLSFKKIIKTITGNDQLLWVSLCFLIQQIGNGIVVGGIGFFVWQDLWINRRSMKKLSVYSRMALWATGILLVGGALIFCFFEWSNPATLGAMGPGKKILNGVFQSVTTRTAGFATFSQADMTEAGRAVSCIWMLIGGCAGSTAGGMKTVTVAVLLLSTWSVARGKSSLTVFRRRISPGQIAMAYAIVTMMVGLAIADAVVLAAGNGIPFLNALFETTSALGTVGLTADVTAGLSAASQIMIIIFMFFGRVGIMTISMGFMMSDRAEERIRFAETKLMIG